MSLFGGSGSPSGSLLGGKTSFSPHGAPNAMGPPLTHGGPGGIHTRPAPMPPQGGIHGGFMSPQMPPAGMQPPQMPPGGMQPPQMPQAGGMAPYQPQPAPATQMLGNQAMPTLHPQPASPFSLR